jgi:hypothetical protein
MVPIETVVAGDPSAVASSLRQHLADTPHQAFLKPFNRHRNTDTVYWLTRYQTPRAHSLAKGTVMPYEPPDEPKKLLVGIYMERGYERHNLAREPFLQMDQDWDWHSFSRVPDKVDNALRDAREQGGPLRLLLRTSMGEIHFAFDQRLTVIASTDADAVKHCFAASTCSELLTVLERTPGIDDAYVDLVIGHAFDWGSETGLTAAQLAKRSLMPWRTWIWAKSDRNHR